MKTIVKTGILTIALIMSSSSFAQEKKRHHFQLSRTINAPASDVWAVVGEDFGAIANSHPKIVSSNYINGSLKSGEGAERVCNFDDKGKKYVQEKQVNYSPEDYSFKVQIFHSEGIPMDPDNSFATYKVIPLDNNTSKLVFDMTYRTKPAFMGSIAKGNLKNTISDYLLSVEHYVLTKEPVNKENFKTIKKKYTS